MRLCLQIGFKRGVAMPDSISMEELIAFQERFNTDENSTVPEYYSRLIESDVVYGQFAYEAATNTGFLGQIANDYMQAWAIRLNGSLLTATQRDSIKLQLAISDVNLRINSLIEENHINIPASQIAEYHYTVFENNGLNRQAWTGFVFEEFIGTGTWMLGIDGTPLSDDQIILFAENVMSEDNIHGISAYNAYTELFGIIVNDGVLLDSSLNEPSESIDTLFNLFFNYENLSSLSDESVNQLLARSLVYYHTDDMLDYIEESEFSLTSSYVTRLFFDLNLVEFIAAKELADSLLGRGAGDRFVNEEISRRLNLQTVTDDMSSVIELDYLYLLDNFANSLGFCDTSSFLSAGSNSTLYLANNPEIGEVVIFQEGDIVTLPDGAQTGIGELLVLLQLELDIQESQQQSIENGTNNEPIVTVIEGSIGIEDHQISMLRLAENEVVIVREPDHASRDNRVIFNLIDGSPISGGNIAWNVTREGNDLKVSTNTILTTGERRANGTVVLEDFFSESPFSSLSVRWLYPSAIDSSGNEIEPLPVISRLSVQCDETILGTPLPLWSTLGDAGHLTTFQLQEFLDIVDFQGDRTIENSTATSTTPLAPEITENGLQIFRVSEGQRAASDDTITSIVATEVVISDDVEADNLYVLQDYDHMQLITIQSPEITDRITFSENLLPVTGQAEFLSEEPTLDGIFYYRIATADGTYILIYGIDEETNEPSLIIAIEENFEQTLTSFTSNEAWNNLQLIIVPNFRNGMFGIRGISQAETSSQETEGVDVDETPAQLNTREGVVTIPQHLVDYINNEEFEITTLVRGNQEANVILRNDRNIMSTVFIFEHGTGNPIIPFSDVQSRIIFNGVLIEGEFLPVTHGIFEYVIEGRRFILEHSDIDRFVLYEEGFEAETLRLFYLRNGNFGITRPNEAEHYYDNMLQQDGFHFRIEELAIQLERFQQAYSGVLDATDFLPHFQGLKAFLTMPDGNIQEYNFSFDHEGTTSGEMRFENLDNDSTVMGFLVRPNENNIEILASFDGNSGTFSEVIADLTNNTIDFNHDERENEVRSLPDPDGILLDHFEEVTVIGSPLGSIVGLSFNDSVTFVGTGGINELWLEGNISEDNPYILTDPNPESRLIFGIYGEQYSDRAERIPAGNVERINDGIYRIFVGDFPLFFIPNGEDLNLAREQEGRAFIVLQDFQNGMFGIRGIEGFVELEEQANAFENNVITLLNTQHSHTSLPTFKTQNLDISGLLILGVFMFRIQHSWKR